MCLLYTCGLGDFFVRSDKISYVTFAVLYLQKHERENSRGAVFSRERGLVTAVLTESNWYLALVVGN